MLDEPTPLTIGDLAGVAVAVFTFGTFVVSIVVAVQRWMERRRLGALNDSDVIITAKRLDELLDAMMETPPLTAAKLAADFRAESVGGALFTYLDAVADRAAQLSRVSSQASSKRSRSATKAVLGLQDAIQSLRNTQFVVPPVDADQKRLNQHLVRIAEKMISARSHLTHGVLSAKP